jgi:hypothetical protein
MGFHSPITYGKRLASGLYAAGTERGQFRGSLQMG